MKGLYFTDIHFGRRNNSKEHNQDCYDFVVWAIIQASIQKVDYIAFLGDWFECRNAVDISTLNIAYQAAVELSKLNIPIYFCIGNHDLYKRFSREQFSTVHYKDIPNFVIVDEPQIHNGVLFCPFLFEEEYDSLIKYSDTPIWAGHFEFSGFSITSFNTMKEGGPTHSMFKDVGLILSGHFHKRQRQDNTLYIGNCFPLDFSDVHDNDRGICVLDHDDLSTTFTAWDQQPTFHRIPLSILKDAPTLNCAKTRIKSLIDIDIAPEELLSIKKDILSKGCREVVFEEHKLDLQQYFKLDDDEVIDTDDFSSLRQLIDLMIDKIDTDEIDKTLLKQILDKTGEFESFGGTSETLEFYELSMQNFYSYGNSPTTINLSELGLFNLMSGENHDVVYDDNDKCRSGTGKSTLLHCISYCCYDRVIKDDVSFDDMINTFNKVNMKCTLKFGKGSNRYHITRRRKAGKNKSTNDVTIHLIDDKDNIIKDLTKDSSANTNKFIKELIGLQFETFTRMVLFTATNTPFFSLPVTSSTNLSQTDILEDLFRLKELTTKAENIKKYQKTLRDKLAIEAKTVEMLERNNNQKKASQQNLINNKEQWDIKNETEIKNIGMLLSNIPDNIEQILEDSTKFQNARMDVLEIHRTIEHVDNNIAQTQKSLSSHIKEVESLSNSKCPYCKQAHFDNDKLSKLTIMVKNEQSTIEELTLAQNQCLDDFEGLAATEAKYAYTEQYKNAVKWFSEKQVLESKLDQLKTQSNPFTIALESLDSTMDIIDYTIVDNIKKELTHCDFLVKILIKKDSFVRKALLKQNLPFLNTKLNEYLAELKLPHLVYFTDELLTSIELKGRPISFSTISNGQIARVNIALCLAFRDVITRMHSPINLLMLDECLDTGLSNNGVMNAARMIRNKAQKENIKMLIVTHRDEIASMQFDKHIKVVYANNFSTAEVLK